MDVLLGGLLAILGGLFASYFSLKREKEIRSFEFFKQLRDDLYNPLLNFAQKFRNYGVKDGERGELRKLLRRISDIIYLCPDNISKDIIKLREKLDVIDDDQIVKIVLKIEENIRKIYNKMSFKG